MGKLIKKGSPVGLPKGALDRGRSRVYGQREVLRRVQEGRPGYGDEISPMKYLQRGDYIEQWFRGRS